MTDRSRRPRGGYTLIEMVMVIGAVSIIIGLCASVLSGLFRIERAGRDSMADARTLARLARQFRQDVRAAAQAKTTTAKEGGGLSLTGADGAATLYLLDYGRLVREDRRGDQLQARESYAAERLGPISFGVEGRRVWAVLARRTEGKPALHRPEVRVEAALGKDHALTEPTGGEK